jgi:hypothetical protein
MNRRSCCAWTGIALLCAVALAGCRGLETQSMWRDREITIDGSPAEWDGVFPTYVEAPNIAIRAVNDEDYLYLCVSSPDRNLAAQMLTRGFTVWFDPKGHEDKVLGIHYPLGTQGPLVAREAMGDRTEAKQTIIDTFQAAGEVLEVLRSGHDEPAVLPVSGHGIEVMPGYEARNFIYEIRAPLKHSKDNPYAIGSKPGGMIGLGFETPDVNLADIREARSRDMFGDDELMGGDDEQIREGDRGAMSAPPGIQGPHDLEGLNIWARLTLAVAADSAGQGGSADTE